MSDPQIGKIIDSTAGRDAKDKPNERPDSPGLWTREGKFYRVWDSNGSLATHEIDGTTGSSGSVIWHLPNLPTGNWKKLGVPVAAGEAREKFREWLIDFGARDWPQNNAIADRAAEIFAGVQELNVYEKLYRHAIDCVDRVFQKCTENPQPILPDFLGLGEDKFRGVVKLAENYRELKQTISRLEGEVAELKRERNNFENAGDHLAADANRFQGSLQKLRDIASSHGWDEGWTHGDLGTWIDQQLNEPTPPPEVIEGRGQSGKPGVYAVYNSQGRWQNVSAIHPGWKFVTGWLYRFLCELPPETIEPKTAFVAPEKPEIDWQLIRVKESGDIMRAFYAQECWFNQVGHWWHNSSVEVISETTGEPIAKEEA